jgi:hypothetical protein
MSLPVSRGQYFYLFINIGALMGQIGMAYSEKVRFLFQFTVCIRLFIFIVCGLLAGLYATYYSLPPLSNCPLPRAESLCAHSSYWVSPRDCGQTLEVRF